MHVVIIHPSPLGTLAQEVGLGHLVLPFIPAAQHIASRESETHILGVVVE